MNPLVLSLFPGGGVLDHAFDLEGFVVVRGPDPIWGGDVGTFHPPVGRFDGVIGGDPCQTHSALANLVRAKGLEPTFPDLTGQYERVVDECQPAWFLRENVPKAPEIKPAGYDVKSFMLDNSTLDDGTGWGYEQMRSRKFWFGVRDGAAPELRKFIKFALFELPTKENAVACDPRTSFIPGGQAEVDAIRKTKVTAVGGNDGHADMLGDKKYRAQREKQRSVTGRHHSNELRTTKERGEGWVGMMPRRTLEEMMELQGMPEDWFKHSPFTMAARRKIVGNAVPVGMGRALAGAVREAMA